ncbi:MAG TPA: patatin-like phospholipase family protein [Gammaproteobacteria bacterium]|nr:patatin-like phospholipase family protein [Gammaproteobacteria bacterium]
MFWWLKKEQAPPRIALVLPGGGARAAYQVGVLRAVARLLPKDAPLPFPIVAGTSAGSINATALAIHARQFRRGVLRISRVWENFHVNQVFRADTLGLMKTGIHWMVALALGGLGKYNPYALLDRRPLRPLLERYVPTERIQDAIDAGALHALAVTATSYRSGHSVTFFQGVEGLEPWDRQRRLGVPARITLDHLMASSAIPFIFPAERVGREYYGDGSMRQIAPLSPAVHLGADKILVVGIRKQYNGDEEEDEDMCYPSLAEIASNVLSSIFLDSLDTDLERLERINKTISLIPDRRLEQGGVTLRPIEVLSISPSQSIDRIAGRHAHLLPRPMRYLLRGVGAEGRHGATLLSYLLFERAFCRDLIALGYHDAMAVKEDIVRFLALDNESQALAAPR